MAAAVLPIRMNHRFSTKASPSDPTASTSTTSTQASASTTDTAGKHFQRIRSSLEQTLRTATRSRSNKPVPVPPSADDFDTVKASRKSTDKGKEREAAKERSSSEDAPKEHKDRERLKGLRKLESRVGFRTSGRDAATPAPSPIPPPIIGKTKDGGEQKVKIKEEKQRVAGHTSWTTPSLRGASVSSPALHHSSQALPSPKSPPPVPASSSTASALASPTRDRSKRGSMQQGPMPISGPSALSARTSPTPLSKAPPGRRPPPLNSPSSPSLATARHRSPSPGTPSRRASRDRPRTPDTPTPHSASRQYPKSNTLFNSPPTSPTSPTSPTVRSKSPPARSRTTPASQRGLTSASTSHLPTNRATSPEPPERDTARRTSVDTARGTRRGSVDAPRRPSAGEYARRPSGEYVRPGAASPTSPSAYVQHSRPYNASTTSLSLPATPEQRELLRSATSILCRELRRAPPHVSSKEWEEVDARLQPLARLERVWSKSGSGFGVGMGGSLINVNGGLVTGGGEERERRVFCEALRDGFVLCQLMNKLRPGTIQRVDPRDDGFKRTTNVNKFLSACSAQSVPADECFYKDDLIEATPESLARVARAIISVVKVVEAPAVDRSKVITGQGHHGTGKKDALQGEMYAQSTFSRATASVPNLSLAQLQRSASPTSPTPASPSTRKRWSPPEPQLPTLRSASPSEGGSGTDSTRTGHNGQTTPGLNGNGNGNGNGRTTLVAKEVPPTLTPRSPLRAQSERDQSVSRSPDPFKAARAESISPSVGSFPESPARQSMVSNTTTEMSRYSSLLDARNGFSSDQGKFGTMRTATTEATSLDMPSFTRAEGSAVAASLSVAEEARKRGEEPGRRQRKPSEAAMADLAGVAEERPEDMAGRPAPARNFSADRAAALERVHLGKGKWPDDFIDVFPQGRTRPIPIKPIERERQEHSPSPASISPPRKLAYISANRRSESTEAIPRRPSHQPRHSLDTSVLAPKESVLRRDISPDGISGPSPRVVLRRVSTKTGAPRSSSLVPRGDLDEGRSTDSPVPFPRSASGDASPLSEGPADNNDKPRQHRGRFQSDIEGSRRKERPDSFDEMGNKKPRRGRFESMANLGVVSSNASASDILSRDSIDGSGRQSLIVREPGKPPTHFQLGNCIGRGQFGSVYRALNLNTGQMVAVKRIRLEGLKEEEVMQLMKEVDLVKSLSHPSIVKYEGMARDENTLSIVLEYAENGSLGQTLKAFGKLNESLVASYVVKILEGLFYLHRSDVVHCDLKAANILTTKNGNVKLSDFGVSLNLRAMEREIKDVAGTPNWMAPEVIELKGASTKSDIWSLGATVIELLTGRPPYAEIANSMSVMFRIVEDDMPPLPEDASPMLEDFLKQCFNKDPSLRPSAELLCEHEWLKKSWSGLKDLRPQDSIPFLRRVSTDFQKSDAQHLFSMPEGLVLSSPTEDEPSRNEFFISTPPLAIPRRFSNEPASPIGTPDDSYSPRDHSFVKTTFGKPMTCRVCLFAIKKSAVLCESCSLIAHSKCAVNAPMTCDLRSQLLQYAHFAEKGSPGGAYANSMDLLKNGGGISPTSPSSDVAHVPGPPSSGMSAETSPVAGSPVRPPTAYKFMQFKTKRSRGSMSPEPSPTQDSSSTSLLPGGSDFRKGGDKATTSSAKPKEPQEKIPLRKKPSMLWRGRGTVQQRPQSFSSDSTSPNTASMRSAANSLSSKIELQTKSSAPASDTNGGHGLARGRPSAPTHKPSHRVSASVASTMLSEDQEQIYASEIPGGLPPDHSTIGHKKKDSNCAIQ